MQAALREDDVAEREELLAWNRLPERDVELVLFYVVGDRAAYREALETVDDIRWYEVAPVDDTSFYLYACEEPRDAGASFRDAFVDLELVVLPPIVFDHRGHIHLTLVGESGSFQRLLKALPADVDATVAGLGEYDRRHGTMAGALSDRQYEAVRAAVELGYYETPASAELADVGAAIGCAASTASDLLARAEAAVMRRIVAGPETTPTEGPSASPTRS